MTDKQISIRFNDDELKTHNQLKDFFGYNGLYGEDSQTLKQAERMALNVLHNLIGYELKDIFERKSKDELEKMREEVAKKRGDCITENQKEPPKSITKPSFNEVFGQ